MCINKPYILFFLLSVSISFASLGQESTNKKKQSSPLGNDQFSSNTQQKIHKNTDQNDHDNIAISPIRTKVISALNLSKNGSNLAAGKVLQLSFLNLTSASQLAISTEKQLNTAEQYLLLISQAYLAKSKSDHKKVIKFLTKAEKLNKSVSIEQLNQPLFYQLHWLLAESYAVMGDFDQAYEHKKIYLHKYADNEKFQKNKLVSLLNDKYQTQKKNKENELLAQQNALEQEKIAQIDILQKQRKRNTIILACLSIVFIVIMFRQYRVRRRLIRLSRTDMLTELINRKTLFYLGERLFKKSQEHSSLLSVIYFDCDFFKRVNDNYGHQVGDEVLKKIAKIGNEVIRSRDIFARIGGEEFVILLPEENLTKAKAVAEHIREKIAQYDFLFVGIKENITASFGVASSEQMNVGFNQLLHTADTAMFKAKEQGRNKVVCFEIQFPTLEKLSIRASNSTETA